MEIEDLKSTWNAQYIKPEAANLEQMRRSFRMGSYTERLTRRMLRMTILPFTISLFIPVCFTYMGMSLWMSVWGFAVMLAMGIINLRLYRGMSKLNLGAVDTRSALKSVITLRRRLARGEMLRIITAVPLLCAMMVVFFRDYDKYTIMGAVAGLIIGAAIGLGIRHRTLTIINSLKSELSVIDGQ